MMPRHRKMELTDLCTGCRKKRSRKMAQLKEKSGKILRATSGTGGITAKRDSEFNTLKTVTSTKECGQLTKSTAREHTGAVRIKNYVVSTQVTGLKTKSTAEVPFSIKMVIVTTDIGWMECLKERAVWFMLTKTFMKGSGMRLREMAMVSLRNVTVITLRVTGLTIWGRARAVTSTTIKINFSLENGSLTNRKPGSTLK